ncbi:MAG: glycerate kinase [Mycobacterium sp.]|nr:glycerate kinase [Mycobacterium sp.]
MTPGLRVLIAPDCFGDSLTAVAAAEAIAAGWRQSRPADSLVLVGLSDGGPGFLDVLSARHPNWEPNRIRVSGPLGAEVDAVWLWDAATSTAYLESARACGLALLGGPPTPRTAVDADSGGVGQLLAAALDRGAHRVVVGLGGTACTDGGLGMIEALGGVLTARRRLAGVDLIVATDVENPLLGLNGAARVFGPQKGADAAAVAVLESRLAGWAAELQAATGLQIAETPGAGAAGGLGHALFALGGHRASGAALIAEHTGAFAQIARCDLVVTGEGRLDGQSLRGKVVGSLAAAAAKLRVPVLVLAGQVELPASELRAAGLTEAFALADQAGSVRRAIEDAAAQLSSLAARTAANLRLRAESGNSPDSGYR